MILFEESLPSLLNGSLKPIEQSSIYAKEERFISATKLIKSKILMPVGTVKKLLGI